MAISHQSIIHKPIDYTAPVDLNLMGKVLQFKQAQYDAGVAQTQNHLDAIASMDIAKAEDKEYLNAKLNNLVSTINNIGGADFSDANVSNQIAGLSSQIYGDNKVIAAKANTAKLRYVQDYYKKLKETKPKEYNPANEAYDMKQFEGWFSDGQVGSNPTAEAGKVNPHVDYMGDWQKMFEKMTRNMKTDITDKGLVYRIDSIEYTSVDQIKSAALKLLTPAQRRQLAIEGRYQFEGVPLENVVKAYDENLYNKIGIAKEHLEDYRTKLQGATSLEDQIKYKEVIAKKEAEVEALLAPVRKNVENMKEDLYLQMKLDGLGDRYAVNRSTTKLQMAQDKMFAIKQEFENKKFEYEQGQDHLRNMIDIADKGLMWGTDLHGNPTLVQDPNARRKGSGDGSGDGGSYEGLTFSTNAPAEQKNVVTEEFLIKEAEKIAQDNEVLLTKMAQEMGWAKGDVKMFITDLMDDGNISVEVKPEYRKIAQAAMDAYKAMARGEKVNYTNLPTGFIEYATNYEKNVVAATAIKETLDEVNAQVMNGISSSPEEKKVLTLAAEYQKRRSELVKNAPSPIAYGGNISGRTSADKKYDDELKALENEFKERGLANPEESRTMLNDKLKNANKKKEELFGSYSDRFNLRGQIMKDDKNKSIAKGITKIARNGSQVYDDKGELTDERDLDFDAVDNLSKGVGYFKTANGYVQSPYLEFQYKTNTDGFANYRVMLDPVTASQLGMNNQVEELKGYNIAMRLRGQAKDLITKTGKKYHLQYDIFKKDPSQFNNSEYYIRVKAPGGTIILKNNKLNPFTSIEQAQKFMEGATKAGSYEEAIAGLNQLANENE